MMSKTATTLEGLSANLAKMSVSSIDVALEIVGQQQRVAIVRSRARDDQGGPGDDGQVRRGRHDHVVREA